MRVGSEPFQKKLLGTLIVTALFLSSAVLYEANLTTVASSALTGANSVVPTGSRILGVDDIPDSPSFASTLIGKDDVKWLRADLNNIQQESYLISDGYSIVANLNGCSTSGTLTLATQCYENAVSTNPQIHYWEIFNEPNNPSYQGGFQNGDPYNDYLLTKAAYQIIKAHNPADYVLAPTLSIYTYASGNNISPSNYAWMAQYWGYGARSYVSYVSLHEYSIGLYGEIPKGASENNSQIIGAGLDKYETLVQKPIWITETGCNIRDQVQQSTCLTQDFTMLFSKPYIQAVFWYELLDYSSSQSVSWGLFTYSNQPKTPVLGSFEMFNARIILDQISTLSENLLSPYNLTKPTSG